MASKAVSWCAELFGVRTICIAPEVLEPIQQDFPPEVITFHPGKCSLFRMLSSSFSPFEKTLEDVPGVAAVPTLNQDEKCLLSLASCATVLIRIEMKKFPYIESERYTTAVVVAPKTLIASRHILFDEKAKSRRVVRLTGMIVDRRPDEWVPDFEVEVLHQDDHRVTCQQDWTFLRVKHDTILPGPFFVPIDPIHAIHSDLSAAMVGFPWFIEEMPSKDWTLYKFDKLPSITPKLVKKLFGGGGQKTISIGMMPAPLNFEYCDNFLHRCSSLAGMSGSAIIDLSRVHEYGGLIKDGLVPFIGLHIGCARVCNTNIAASVEHQSFVEEYVHALISDPLMNCTLIRFLYNYLERHPLSATYKYWNELQTFCAQYPKEERVERQQGQASAREEIESLQGMPSVTVTRVDGNSCWIEMAVDKGYYQSATLGFCIDFPATYPLEAPTVHTVGRIYHPNISYDQGQIHLAILKHWAPSLHLYHVVQAIENMLLHPDAELEYNAAGILNQDAAELLAHDPAAFADKVQAGTDPLHYHNVD